MQWFGSRDVWWDFTDDGGPLEIFEKIAYDNAFDIHDWLRESDTPGKLRHLRDLANRLVKKEADKELAGPLESKRPLLSLERNS